MRTDLLHLIRSLRRSPSSALAAIVTLALTLGAGASIFAVVDAVLLTPPPFTNPDDLVSVGEIPVDDAVAAPRAVGYSTFEAWRDRAGSLAAVEAFDATNATLTGFGAAERVSATNVTPGFLTILGVTPALGRAFDLDDVGQPVVLVSHAFWRGTLGADPGVVGRSVVLGGQPHTIVGVLPTQFFFALNPCDFWRPFPVASQAAARAGYRVRAVARLAPHVTPAYLAAALDGVSRLSSPPARASAVRIATAIAGDATRILGLLSGAAALATVIAFINLAGLIVVRGIDRGRELAVRSALGAPRIVVARQLLLEALALVAMGIAGGVLLASWMTPVVARLTLTEFGGVATRSVAVSWRVIGILSLVASACGCLCGSVAAVAATRRSVVDLLHRGATAPPRELMVRRVLVAAEMAIGFVLLVSVALLGRSLLNVLDVNPGFDARGVMTLRVSLPAASYPDDERVAAFYSTLERALSDRLGSGAISFVDEIPLTGDRGRTLVNARTGAAGPEAVVRAAGPAYFDVMRIPVIGGRPFDDDDNHAVPTRVVISRSLADRLFAAESPIGRRVWLAAATQPADVVGVVGDVKHRSLDETASPTVYLSLSQSPSRSSHVVVRSARPDADIAAVVREEVARLDRVLPVYGTRSMREVVDTSPGVPARRVLTATFAGFALLAVVLGGIGLFGVVAHDVARRRGELALRMVLGADPMRILRSIVAQGALMAGAGLATGGPLSLWTARALGSLVSDGDWDALSLAAAAGVLLVMAAAAILPAALRAARTDPVTALRAE